MAGCWAGRTEARIYVSPLVHWLVEYLWTLKPFLMRKGGGEGGRDTDSTASTIRGIPRVVRRRPELYEWMEQAGKNK